MQTLIAFNIVVLAGLLIFFLRETMRFRRFSTTVTETKADLAVIVHQLRSPLSNLRKYNEFLQSEEFGALSIAQQEAVSKVQSSLAESLIILDRLLARVRLDERDIATLPASLNVQEVVQGAVDAMIHVAKAKTHTLNVMGNAKVQIFADPLLLHGILDEIVANAIHYTPEGGTITITIADTATAVIISVEDTGMGISKIERPHIFEKFFRGQRTMNMHVGSGLGLSFAKQFTQKMGGTIRFISKEGKGSTFMVSLRKKRPAPVE